MRCCCCNSNLNDYESTLRSIRTGDYLDMCRKCLTDLNIETAPNKNEPTDMAPEIEHYWNMPEVDINLIQLEDDE